MASNRTIVAVALLAAMAGAAASLNAGTGSVTLEAGKR